MVLVFPTAGLPGCGSTSERPTARVADAPVVRGEEPIRLTAVPPPAGSDTEGLAPLEGEDRTRAQLSLEEVIKRLPPVGVAGGGVARAQVEPPLAAQKFYATGRQALLEGDNFAAAQAFDKALRLAPRSKQILRSLGLAWGRAGNRVTAASHLRRAVAADPDDFDSTLTLGRFAADERRFDEAISAFAHALDLAEREPDTVDPAAAPLIRFFLARVLSEAGYARAADANYAAYLDTPRGRLVASPLARDLTIVDAQRGETLVRRGDLAHRLDDPESALGFYLAARQVGVMSQAGLRKRLLYTRLRLGQTEAARELAVGAATESHGDTAALALVNYAVQHGVPASALSDRLAELYAREGRPTALALAVAKVLPPDDAARLLDDHLAFRPDDAEVLERRLQLALGPDGVDGNPDASMAVASRRTAAAIRQTPGRAESFADPLLALTPGGGAGLVAALETSTFDPHDAAVDYLYGRALVAAGRPDDARVAFERAAASPLQIPGAREAWAELLIEAGDHAGAQAVLAPLADAHRPRTDRLRVRALTDSGRGDEALALIDGLMTDATDAPALLRQKAALLRERGDVPGAERALLDALNAAPTDEAIYADLLDLYEANPALTQNLQRLWRRMIDTIPRARITRRQLVFLQLASNDLVSAEKLLLPLLAETPDDPELEGAAAQIYAGTGRGADLDALVNAHLARSARAQRPPSDNVMRPAIAYARRANDVERVVELKEAQWLLRPASARRSVELAGVRLTQERYAAAAELARSGLEDDFEPPTKPAEIEALLRVLTQALLEVDRGPEAATAIHEALKGDPAPDAQNMAGLLAGLGIALVERDRTDEAKAVVMQAIDQDLDQALAVGLTVSNAIELKNDVPGAEALRESLLEHFPDNAQICNTLGYAWANRGERLDEAAKLIGRALEVEGDSAAYLDSMGWVRYKQGRFAESLELLERGRAAEGGDHAVIVDHVGDVLYRLDREADAVRAWTDASRRAVAAAGNPSDPANQDPELEGLAGRIAAKLAAVAEGRPAPVAALGRGIALPAEAEAEGGVEPAPAPVTEEPAAAAPAVGEPGAGPGEAVTEPTPAASARSADQASPVTDDE